MHHSYTHLPHTHTRTHSLTLNLIQYSIWNLPSEAIDLKRCKVIFQLQCHWRSNRLQSLFLAFHLAGNNCGRHLMFFLMFQIIQNLRFLSGSPFSFHLFFMLFLLTFISRDVTSLLSRLCIYLLFPLLSLFRSPP